MTELGKGLCIGLQGIVRTCGASHPSRALSSMPKGRVNMDAIVSGHTCSAWHPQPSKGLPRLRRLVRGTRRGRATQRTAKGGSASLYSACSCRVLWSQLLPGLRKKASERASQARRRGPLRPRPHSRKALCPCPSPLTRCRWAPASRRECGCSLPMCQQCAHAWHGPHCRTLHFV